MNHHHLWHKMQQKIQYIVFFKKDQDKENSFHSYKNENFKTDGALTLSKNLE